MTIDISITQDSVNDAISQIKDMLETLKFKAGELVDTLASQGADIAQEAFGSMAKATSRKDDETTAVIQLTGKAPGIAEFGAGYATMEWHPFAKNVPYPVEVGSYSRERLMSGTGGMFAKTDADNPGNGFWIFGEESYDRVQPRRGLLDASDWIVENSADIAKEVMKLD